MKIIDIQFIRENYEYFNEISLDSYYSSLENKNYKGKLSISRVAIVYETNIFDNLFFTIFWI